MVCSHHVLPLSDDPMKGVLGNLEDPSVFLQTRNEEGAYLVSCQIMSPSQRWGMNPFVKMSNVPKEPTHGQLDGGLSNLLAEDWMLDDWVLHVGHSKSSVVSEMGQGELMGSICCTRIPFILVTTSQSHLSPLSRP